MNKGVSRGWFWVPSLYLFQGLPYTIVVSTSVLLYQVLGFDVAEFVFWTSLLSLPWTVKPLWSPVLEMFGRKLQWILYSQLLIVLGFVSLAFLMGNDNFFTLSLVLFFAIAFCSATHDIACDGFYMIGLDRKEQSLFVGIRSTFYRLAMLAASGLLPIVVGVFALWSGGDVVFSWKMGFVALAVVSFVLFLVNFFAMPKVDEKRVDGGGWQVYVKVVRNFFSREGVVPALLFLLFYRLGESQLVKMVVPFLMSDSTKGGLSLSVIDYGLIYGTVGTVALTVGGILGGVLVSRYGLKRLLWPMALFMNLPNVAYLVLSVCQPQGASLGVWAAVLTEQFGYGFGFTAYMLFMLDYVRDSEYKTAEYALATTFMALGMMLPGMVSGYVFEWLGSYQSFFTWVLLCCLPGMAIIPFLKLRGE